MDKFEEFYNKAMADEQAKSELKAVFGGKKTGELSDDELSKVVTIAEKLGFAITLEEVKEYLSGEDEELSDDDLDKVSGGFLFFFY